MSDWFCCQSREERSLNCLFTIMGHVIFLIKDKEFGFHFNLSSHSLVTVYCFPELQVKGKRVKTSTLSGFFVGNQIFRQPVYLFVPPQPYRRWLSVDTWCCWERLPSLRCALGSSWASAVTWQAPPSAQRAAAALRRHRRLDVNIITVVVMVTTDSGNEPYRHSITTVSVREHVNVTGDRGSHASCLTGGLWKIVMLHKRLTGLKRCMKWLSPSQRN